VGHVTGSRASTDGYALLLAVGFNAATVAAVRHAVRDVACRCPMSDDRLDDFVVAVNEIMTNVVRHGGGNGHLQLWRDGDLLCQIIDHGSGFDPRPYLTRDRPEPSPSGGMGLWLAQRTSDTLSWDSGPAGTTIGIQSRLSGNGSK